VLVSDNRPLPLPTITGGRALPRCHPLNLETLGNRNLLQLHTAEPPELLAPTRSWPAARRLMSLPHCERRAPIDTTNAAVHKTKRQAVSSVYSHTMSQFGALIVRYIGSCLQTWAIKLVCNKRKSTLSESVITESFYIEFLIETQPGPIKRSVLTECPLCPGPF